MNKSLLRSKGTGSFLGVRETSIFDLANDRGVRESLEAMKRFMKASSGSQAKMKVTVTKTAKKETSAA